MIFVSFSKYLSIHLREKNDGFVNFDRKANLFKCELDEVEGDDDDDGVAVDDDAIGIEEDDDLFVFLSILVVDLVLGSL